MFANKPESLANQRGASAIIVLVCLGMAALILLTAFKLYPVYFDHWAIMSVADSFEAEPALEEMSERDVDKRFMLRLQTNNVRDFDYDDSVLVEMDEGLLSITVDYEKRVNIYNNIDAVVVFKEERLFNY